MENTTELIKKLIEADGAITNKSWRSIRGISSKEATKELNGLVSTNDLKKVGNKRGTKYLLP